LSGAEVLGAFMAQFYDDKPAPRLILVSEDFEERELLAEALTAKSERKVEISVPQRGERKELVMHALANGREALARKLADTASQQRLLKALTETFALRASRAASRSMTIAISAAPMRSAPWSSPGRKASARTSIANSTSARPTSRRRRLRHDARSAAAALQAPDRREPAADGGRSARCRFDR